MKKKSYLLLLFWVVLSCSSEGLDTTLTEGIQDSEEINTSSPVSGSESSTTEPSYAGRTGLSLGPNQTTVIAGSDVTPGDRIVFNETEYLVVDNQLLREIVADQREDLSKIVTTYVTDMSSLFQNKQTLTPNISSWDTAQVTSMRSMFQGSTLYNGDISYWNTQSVTDFAYMFAHLGNVSAVVYRLFSLPNLGAP